jgi:hypothetical protein
MYNDVDEFLQKCRKLTIGTYLANQDWSLDHLETPTLEGIILYLQDMESGYLQIVLLPPEADTTVTDSVSMDEIVSSIGYLLKRVQANQGDIEKHKARLASALGVYAYRTQNFAVAKKTYGNIFSFYIMARGTKKKTFELRPFTASTRSIEKPDTVKQNFTMVAKQFNWMCN